MSENDALTLALIDSNEAQAILERTNPSVKELKEAVKLFKKAAKELNAAVTLLTEGCYKVAERPAE